MINTITAATSTFSELNLVDILLVYTNGFPVDIDTVISESDTVIITDYFNGVDK